MRNPAVDVKILDDCVPDVAQRLTDSIKSSNWKGKIDEVALLGELLHKCGADVYDEDRGHECVRGPWPCWNCKTCNIGG